MKRLRRVALGLGVPVALLLWFGVRMGLEFRDWLDSDTWVATPSTRFRVQPRTSGVRYGYTVDGEHYTGERTHFFVVAPHQDRRHLDWLHEHRRASGVTVYHDPDWPARAVLVREVDAGLWIALGLGLGVVAVMVGVPVLVFGGLWWWLWRAISGRGD